MNALPRPAADLLRGKATRGIRNHDKITECDYTAHSKVGPSVGRGCMGGNQSGAHERGRLSAAYKVTGRAQGLAQARPTSGRRLALEGAAVAR